MDVLQRFEAKIDKRNDGCWQWTGATGSNGYGRFRYAPKKTGLAHRFAYEHYIGPIPAGHTIDHLCRNRGCVNPAHLEAVTPRTNVLRGDTVVRANVEKTHCPRGHPYDSVNTRVTKNGKRVCRECMKEHQRRWKEKSPDGRRSYFRDYQRRLRERQRNDAPSA